MTIAICGPSDWPSAAGLRRGHRPRRGAGRRARSSGSVRGARVRADAGRRRARFALGRRARHSCRLPLEPSMMVMVWVPGAGAALVGRRPGAAPGRWARPPDWGLRRRAVSAPDRWTATVRSARRRADCRRPPPRSRKPARTGQAPPPSACGIWRPAARCVSARLLAERCVQVIRRHGRHPSANHRDESSMRTQRGSAKRSGRPEAAPISSISPVMLYCGSAARLPLGGKAELVTVPRSRSTAIFSALSSFGSGGM